MTLKSTKVPDMIRALDKIIKSYGKQPGADPEAIALAIEAEELLLELFTDPPPSSSEAQQEAPSAGQ